MSLKNNQLAYNVACEICKLHNIKTEEDKKEVDYSIFGEYNSFKFKVYYFVNKFCEKSKIKPLDFETVARDILSLEN